MINKIKINIQEGKLNLFEIGNIVLWSYGKFRGKKFNTLNPYKKTENLSTRPTFYLKVNRDIEDSILCLQRWIDIANAYGSDFYILCDNDSLRKRILNNINFYTPEIKFIRSQKDIFKNILKLQNISPKWVNAACAHLTVFEHSKKNNIENYWNIDADDSLFLTEIKNVLGILKEAENYATINDIDLFSFDFWATKTQNHHWSFGITYQRNTKDYFELLKNNFINWENYKNWTSVHNIDWVFTFLKNTTKINAKSFYVENLYFIHFGRFFSDLKNANIAYWSDGKMYWPIWSHIFKDQRGVFEIPQTEDIARLNYDIIQEDCLNFAIKHLVKWDRLPLVNSKITY